jgi:hypothetical protein
MIRSLVILPVLFLSFAKAHSQYSKNWTENELIEPSDLSTIIKSNKSIPMIFSVGPGAVIPNSKDIGMAKETENLQKFKDELAGISKDTQIVIYCGCCPFEHCPNIRPAIEVLKSMNFTNYRLLNLPHNIKIDWIDKGYPMQQ